MPTILETFDLPQMNPNCIQRMDSTVVSQPLHLLNNKLIHELAAAFAERVQREAQDDPREQIELAWRIALGRSPSDEERAISLQSLDALAAQWQTESGADRPERSPQQNALRDYCHALINSAAYLYID
jgi:hypothetical protein